MDRPIVQVCYACGISDILRAGEGEPIIGHGECHRKVCTDLNGDYSKHPRFLKQEVSQEASKKTSVLASKAEPQSGSGRPPRREFR